MSNGVVSKWRKVLWVLLLYVRKWRVGKVNNLKDFFKMSSYDFIELSVDVKK